MSPLEERINQFRKMATDDPEGFHYWELADAARFANAAAALKCTRAGGRSGAPSRAEVDAYLGTASAG